MTKKIANENDKKNANENKIQKRKMTKSSSPTWVRGDWRVGAGVEQEAKAVAGFHHHRCDHHNHHHHHHNHIHHHQSKAKELAGMTSFFLPGITVWQFSLSLL